jgi:hypothetical protein
MIDPVIAMVPSLVELIQKLLAKKTVEELRSDLPKGSLPTSEKLDSLEKVFAISRNRLKNIWTVTLVMTISAFVLIIGMIALAVYTGVVIGEPGYGIIFGGVGVSTIFGVILWKPLDKMFESNKAIQIQDLLMAFMKTKIEECKGHADINERNSCIDNLLKYIMSEMNKL